jgi:hypothetical protein
VRLHVPYSNTTWKRQIFINFDYYKLSGCFPPFGFPMSHMHYSMAFAFEMPTVVGAKYDIPKNHQNNFCAFHERRRLPSFRARMRDITTVCCLVCCFLNVGIDVSKFKYHLKNQRFELECAPKSIYFLH